MKNKILTSMIAVISIVLLFSSIIMSRKKEKKVYGLERLKQMAQEEIVLKEYFARINGKKIPITDKKSIAAFKFELFQRKILKKNLQKKPSLFKEAEKMSLKKRPMYATLKQGDEYKITIFIDETSVCNVFAGKRLSVLPSQLKSMACIDEFSDPGGFDSTKKVEVFFSLFDPENITDPLYEREWDRIVRMNLIKLSNQIFLNELKNKKIDENNS